MSAGLAPTTDPPFLGRPVDVGLVTDVVRFSCVDGPGSRYVVFLQGCNFDCLVCHNPYTIAVCTHCGECIDTCPSGALTLDGVTGRVVWDDTVCASSDVCIDVCPEQSTPKARERRVDEVLADLRRAAPFLSGITVSGGEPTGQAAFVRSLFAAVKGDPGLAHLSTLVDTNGAADPEVWDTLAPVMDGAMVDLKALDPARHEQLTGQPNDRTLASIRHLARIGRLEEVRIVLVPGHNDDPDLLERTAAWLAGVAPDVRVVLLGFRTHGVRPAARDIPEPDAGAMADDAGVFRRAGFTDVRVV